MRLKATIALVVIALAAACSGDDEGAAPPGATSGMDGSAPGAADGGPGAGDDDDVPVPTEPAVAFIGRFADDGDAKIFAWPGSRIIARWNGTSVSARIAEQSLYEGPSVLDVKVDGNVTKLALTEGEKTYELAQGLPAGEHVVELYRRTEGQVGRTLFRGFDYRGGTLLPPPRARAHLIEILGDSTTAGYGIEGDGPDCQFSGATENFAKSWGALAASMLDADAIGIVYSGKGVLQNNDRSDPILFDQIYLRATPESAAPAWDFTKTRAPGAVVLLLGGNDWDQPDPNVNDAPSLDAFAAKYAKLLELIRGKYPQTRIIAALSPTQSDDYPAGYAARTNQRKAFSDVVKARNDAGDANVHFLDVAQAAEAEKTACESHPGVALHTRTAEAVAAAVKKATGW